MLVEVVEEEGGEESDGDVAPTAKADVGEARAE
jgi:hypothetical protein